MIPAFNCADYLRLTLRSVLDQDPGRDRMHIQVVDDCSTRDDPQAVVRELAGDRVEFYRHEKNKGVGGNLAACAARSRGRYVHVLHGDDLVKPGFYAQYEAMIAAHPEASLFLCPADVIDENGTKTSAGAVLGGKAGRIEDFDLIQAVQNGIMTPSVVIPRRTLEAVGGYDLTLGHTADWEMFYRAGLHGYAVTTDQPLVLYRMASTNDTSRLMMSGKNIEEILKAIDACVARLPAERAAKLPANRYQWAAQLAYSTAERLARMGKFKAAANQHRWAWRLGCRGKRSALRRVLFPIRGVFSRG
jgi:glycosyltransferase involved in cell wall biosynthesis